MKYLYEGELVRVVFCKFHTIIIHLENHCQIKLLYTRNQVFSVKCKLIVQNLSDVNNN